jgi:hypothetical protein
LRALPVAVAAVAVADVHNPITLALLPLIVAEAEEMAVGYSQTMMEVLMIVLPDVAVDVDMGQNLRLLVAVSIPTLHGR